MPMRWAAAVASVVALEVLYLAYKGLYFWTW